MLCGELPWGRLDGRPIQNLSGAELRGAVQFHAFAGVGGWPLALKLAGWPDDREVWTGSCPCQPFSSAGKGKGVEDERHLWPDFLRLIAECRPATVFGEQVASKAGRQWLAGVRADLETLGYRVGRADLCAAGVGAPHIRQRLYWVADHGRFDSAGRRGIGDLGKAESRRKGQMGEQDRQRIRDAVDDSGKIVGLGQNPASIGRPGRRDGDSPRHDGQVQAQGLCAPGGVQHAAGDGRIERGPQSGERSAESRCEPGGVADGEQVRRPTGSHEQRSGAEEQKHIQQSEQNNPIGPWDDYRIIPCTDGKARRTGARVFPLAHGIPRGVDGVGTWRKGLARSASRARVGMLKGSGNAIVPELAAEFVRAYMETLA